MRQLSRVVILLALVSLATGCSFLRYRNAQAPRVSVTGIELAGFSIFEQRFDVGLRLQNPNDFQLPITGMDYQLFVEDAAVASGLSDTVVTLPAWGEKQITVSVIGNVLNSLSQLRRWQQSGSNSLDYRLEGRLKMADVAFKIPFTQRGSFDLKLQ